MEFDAPLFKLLAHNDTGQAVGHQGGIVVPKALDEYFPQLSRRATREAPAPEEFVVADLFDGSRFLSTVETRYQYQTWGGERSPERRLTKNLTPLRNLARADDLLIIQRSLSDPSYYRLTLVRQTNPIYRALKARVGDARWGLLEPGNQPTLETEVERQVELIEARKMQDFALFEVDPDMTETRSRRIARSRAFQRLVSSVYDFSCAVCGKGLLHPSGRHETQSAHIVPRHKSGSDDIRNGIQMCRAHHWAFDEGILGIGADYRILVPSAALSIPQNEPLADLVGREIRLPHQVAHFPHPSALQWHLDNMIPFPD